MRYSYPAPLAELAILIALRHGKCAAAKALSLPTSTMYRWFDDHQRTADITATIENTDYSEKLHKLIADCEAHGFEVRTALSMLEFVRSGPAVDSHHVENANSSINKNQQEYLLKGMPGLSSDIDNDELLARPDYSPKFKPAANTIGVALARTHIHTRYYSKLSCEKLAHIAGLSKFHFIKSFKSTYGVTPYRYLMQIRIGHARHLLSTTSQPLDAVAAAVGFDALTSLCRSFKTIEGISLAAFFRGMRFGTKPSRPRGENGRVELTHRV